VSNFENLTTTVEKVDWIAVARDFYEREQRKPVRGSKNETIYISQTEKSIAQKINNIKNGVSPELLKPFQQIFGADAMKVVKENWIEIAKNFYEKEKRTPIHGSKNETIYINQFEKQIAAKINKIKDGKNPELLQPFIDIFGAEAMKVVKENWIEIAQNFYEKERRRPVQCSENETIYISKTEKQLAKKINHIKNNKVQHLLQPFKAIFGEEAMKVVKEETNWLLIAKEFYQQEQRLPTHTTTNKKIYLGKTERDLGMVISNMKRGTAYKKLIEPFKQIFGNDFLEK
jgi:hypothetical protein